MTKISRNAPCPCGSGLKYKRCCEGKDIAAEMEKALGTLDPDERAVLHLFEHVYLSVLTGVWTAFHGKMSEPLSIEEMEDFYQEIHGEELDPALIDEIILPLSPRALAQLKAIAPPLDEKVVEVASEEIAPSAPRAD
jgi:hypothetical protein